VHQARVDVVSSPIRIYLTLATAARTVDDDIRVRIITTPISESCVIELLHLQSDTNAQEQRAHSFLVPFDQTRGLAIIAAAPMICIDLLNAYHQNNKARQPQNLDHSTMNCSGGGDRNS